MKIRLVGGVLVLLVSVAVAYLVTEKLLFDPDPPTANYPEPKDIKEAQLQDIDYMGHLLELDRSYSDQARATATAFLNELKTQAGTLSEPEFELKFARLSAFADNGHTNVATLMRAEKYARLPIRTYWFSDGFYIVRAYKGYETLLGGRVLKVDGKPLSEVEAMLRPYVGGTEEYFHAFQFSYYFEFPDFLHAAGITKAADRVQLTLEFQDGRQEEVIFEGDYKEAKGPAGYPYHMIYRDNLIGETGWYNLLQNLEPISFSLENVRPFTIKELPNLNAYYIRYWSNNDVGQLSISDFNGKVASALEEKQSFNAIILDVRNNRGGNYTLNQKVMLSLGSHLAPEGTLYIITGRDTFSAGMYAAAFAKAGAGEKTVIIGTRMGDRDIHWGENNRFTLPNSGVRTSFTRGLHNLTGPCEEIWKCYWRAYFFYDPVDSLELDINVPFNFSDYVQGEDAVLEKILEIEKKKSGNRE